ncbi:MAG TPA: hypothetical protein VGM21_21090 [Actinomycetota bacterium]|jgi:hypothetical protein
MTSLQDDPDAKRARELAAEARAFLDAEGFSNERIDELARAFVARDEDDDDFTAWALGQGRIP